MNILLLFSVFAIVIFAGSALYSALQLSRLRKSGVYPAAGQATMADVARLKSLGLSVWAIRCYREIHGGSLRQAKESVQNLG